MEKWDSVFSIKNGKLWFLIWLITAVFLSGGTWATLKNRIERTEERLVRIETYYETEKEKQPIRDYILSELARKSGIEIPRNLK